MARADSQKGKKNVRGIWGESKLQKAIMGLLYLNILADWKSVVQGKSVDLGGRRIIKKKKTKKQ